ncbi:MAG: class I SAM-dependent methyltransferase [Candidatus Aenigmarchaeota archaeon]|nr:class I SAM-dependent methyltransferase [Candidatus Aenigmarchaeota archaeon]
MNILKLNKKAWDTIGVKAASNYIKHKKYLEVFNLFCNKLAKGCSVLDFGCGPGLPFTKELVKKGFKVTAIDISDTMIKEAKTNVPQAKYIRVSMTDIDFEEKFDGVFSGYTMLCLDPKNFEMAAKKAVRSLRPGGFFFLALNEPPPEGHDEKESYTEIMGQKMYSRPYTESEVRKVFSRLDMKIIKVGRETVRSKEYGDEHTLLVLMQKSS